MCLSWVCLAFGPAADDLTAARRGAGAGGGISVPPARLPSFLPSFQEQTACCLGRSVARNVLPPKALKMVQRLKQKTNLPIKLKKGKRKQS